MTFRLVIFVVLACLVLDRLVRLACHRLKARRERLEHERYLSAAVRLEFAAGTASLTRVQMASPRARILAVDDEPVVLDSLRRILVLEGCSIDTVRTGPEALSLLRGNDYDFVFTDLRMPDMDGVEVVKAAKLLRPDVDVVVLTGYGTIETAVETMKFGACEFLRKPFTADELAEHVEQLLGRRQARLRAARRSAVRIVLPGSAEPASCAGDAAPGGSFLASGHTWVWVEPGGQVRIGVDTFAHQALGAIGEVLLPGPGLAVRRGDPLFTFRRGAEELHFPAPVSGKVQDLNGALAADPSRAARSPYQEGWICRMDPDDLAGELGRLRFGETAQAWCAQELDRLQALRDAVPDPPGPLPWATLAQAFFARERLPA